MHAAKKFRGDGWIQYDRNVWKRTAAGAIQKWGEVDTSLWALAFGNAEPREHCAMCYSLDHSTQECGDYEKPKASSTTEFAANQSTPPICLKWNW